MLSAQHALIPATSFLSKKIQIYFQLFMDWHMPCFSIPGLFNKEKFNAPVHSAAEKNPIIYVFYIC
jgi:hypothetical protein